MIEINNLTTHPIEEEFLKKICQKVLEGEKKKGVDLSLALVGPRRIRALNKKYRKKNRVTDVLAFPESEVLSERFKVGFQKEVPRLGEIVICLREVKKNAKRFGSTFKRELSRVLIHGILHLLGYDHEKGEKEAKEMKEKEDHYLSEIFKKEAGFLILFLDFLFVAILIVIIIVSLSANKEILASIISIFKK